MRTNELKAAVAARLVSEALVPGLTSANVELEVIDLTKLKPDQYPHVFIWGDAETVELTQAWRQEFRTLTFLIDVCTNDAKPADVRDIVDAIQADFMEHIWESATFAEPAKSKAPEFEFFEFPDRSEVVGRLTFEATFWMETLDPGLQAP